MQQMILPLAQRLTSKTRKLHPEDWVCPTTEVVLRALLLLIAPVLDGASVNNANDATFAVEKFRIYGREVSSFLGNVMTACRSVNPSGQEVLSNAWAPQGQALRIMLITLRLVTHLPPVCLLSKRWGAEKAEEEVKKTASAVAEHSSEASMATATAKRHEEALFILRSTHKSELRDLREKMEAKTGDEVRAARDDERARGASRRLALEKDAHLADCLRDDVEPPPLRIARRAASRRAERDRATRRRIPERDGRPRRDARGGRDARALRRRRGVRRRRTHRENVRAR